MTSTYVVEVAAEGSEKPPKEFDPRTAEAEVAAVTAGCSVADAAAVAAAGGMTPNERDAKVQVLMEIMKNMIKMIFLPV